MISKRRNEPTVASGHADAVSLTGARLAFGDRVLWDHLDLSVSPGEFIAVLGPNGSGKTSLLKVLLGQLPLSAGVALVDGKPDHLRQRTYRLRAATPAAGPRCHAARPRPGSAGHRRIALGRPAAAIRRSGPAPRRRAAGRCGRSTANGLADVPVGVMSGGELQRMRIAQALASDPMLLLCDEPLLTLDPANARLVAALIDRRRRDADTTVILVTHEVNPILPYVDRVLYLVDGRFRIGTVEQVMTSETLSELYHADIQVVKVKDRYVVIGDTGQAEGHP